MQISDIGQWMGRIAPLKADEAQAKQGLDQVDAEAPNNPEDSSVTLKDQAYLRYLAHKYSMSEMTLHDWKNFQMEATEMGLMPMKSVLDFAKQTEQKIFHANTREAIKAFSEVSNDTQTSEKKMSSEINTESKNMAFELNELLKKPCEFSTKQQLREWHALVQSVTTFNKSL